MNITHDVVVDGVELTVEAVHTTSEGDAQRMHVEVFRDGELIGSQRLITKPTNHFVTGDGMVDTAEPCNCGPNAACSNCPRPDVPVATKREAALAAVYEAIERQASYSHIDNPGALTGLAALVDALVSATVTEARA